MGNVEDGIYEGEYDVGYIYARVEVEVKDGMILSINLLEHRNERGQHAESIIDDIISKQSKRQIIGVYKRSSACDILQSELLDN